MLSQGIKIGEHYIIEEKIALRAHSQIYRGSSLLLPGREVAIKLFKPLLELSPSLIEAYQAEVNLLIKTSHTTLVPVLAGGYEHGYLYLVMEYIPGISLEQRLNPIYGPVALDQALALLTDLAEALSELHDHGLVHGYLDASAVLFKGYEIRLAGYIPKVVFNDCSPLDFRTDIRSLAKLFQSMIAEQIPANLEKILNQVLQNEQPISFNSVNEFIDALYGGKKPCKNPLAEAIGFEQIGSSLSNDILKEILRVHAAQGSINASTSIALAISSTAKTQSEVTPLPDQEDLTLVEQKTATEQDSKTSLFFSIIGIIIIGISFYLFLSSRREVATISNTTSDKHQLDTAPQPEKIVDHNE
jgi:hypothetical protein